LERWYFQNLKAAAPGVLFLCYSSDKAHFSMV